MFATEYDSKQLTEKALHLNMELRHHNFLAHIVYFKNHSTLCGAALINLYSLIAPASCVPDDINIEHYIVYFGCKRNDTQMRGIIRKRFYHENQINFAVLKVSFSTRNSRRKTLII